MTSYWLLVRAALAPEKPASAVSSRSRSPSPSAKQTVFFPSRVTLMSAFVRSCSESLVILSRLVPALHDQDGPGPPHVVGLGLGRARHGVHELDLQLARERLVVLEAVLSPAHVAAALEVGDLHVVLEAGDHLLRLVGEAVALVLGEVPLLRAADGQVVEGAEDAEHDEHHDERCWRRTSPAGGRSARPCPPSGGGGGGRSGRAPRRARGGSRRAASSPQRSQASAPTITTKPRGARKSMSFFRASWPRPSTAGSPPTGGRGRGRSR